MEDQSTARLLASSLHEMRNILAVIAESAGLARDVATFAAQNGEDAKDAGLNTGPNANMLDSALQGTQEGTENASRLVSAMEYMAQMCGLQDGVDLSCDLDRACQGFCLMAKRWAKSVCIGLTSGTAQESVWGALPVPLLYDALLEILDLCASVGGQISLQLTAGHWCKTEGIFVVLNGGDNLPLALTAMTGKTAFDASDGNYQVRLEPANGDGATYRFFLSFARP